MIKSDLKNQLGGRESLRFSLRLCVFAGERKVFRKDAKAQSKRLSFFDIACRFIATTCFLVSLVVVSAAAQIVKLTAQELKQRVDVEIDGKPFTSYRWDASIKRPVLLPLMSVGGEFITRGFPIETRAGETVGHPHQVGVSFSYGDVNGFDFWNNSTFRKADERIRMGTIVHRKIVKIKSGKTRGELVTEADWLTPNGEKILTETTRYIFAASGTTRRIDRETTLTANGNAVVFGDNKEGLFAIHLNRRLQQDNQIPAKITDAQGNITEARSNENLSGEYLSSEGLTGERIWGTLGKWVSVSGKIGAGETITVAVFDSPKNLNYPSSMMVRPYGLLALNPFGRKAFDPKTEARKFILEPQKSVKFRHRLLILAEKAALETLEKEYRNYIK